MKEHLKFEINYICIPTFEELPDNYLASHEKIKAIAITCSSAHNPVTTPAAPCGICRQTIFEAECKHQQNIEVILMGESGKIFVFKSIKDLLPLHFDADFL